MTKCLLTYFIIHSFFTRLAPKTYMLHNADAFVRFFISTACEDVHSKAKARSLEFSVVPNDSRQFTIYKFYILI